MSKILITGATGLVGQAIVNHSLKQGISINFLTTNKEKIVSQPYYRGYYWNPDSSEIDLDCFKEVDTIINLAGASIGKRWTPSWKKQLIDSRIKSLQLLYKSIKENNLHIKQLISSSAIGYYPNSLTNFYDESYIGKADSFLSKLVYDWEVEADLLNELNIKVAKLRIGIVLAPKGGALEKLSTPIRNYVGASLGSGNQWQSWIHIDDLVNLFMFVSNHNLEGVFNGVAPNPVTQQTFTKSIAKTLKRPLILPRAPSFLLRIMLGEMSEIVLASQRVSSKRIENLGFKFKYNTVDVALEDLLANMN